MTVLASECATWKSLSLPSETPLLLKSRDRDFDWSSSVFSKIEFTVQILLYNRYSKDSGGHLLVKNVYRDYLWKSPRSEVQPAEATTAAVSPAHTGRSHHYVRIFPATGSN
ncbi:hypothetical protein [aff. Roholtiella sp. LEGE 12411]|uniref:hypothetical protein n=1 Tax=aff. Roholtiella sp. LEGE 12411 TaxID=1828822 RepID=UPI001ABC66A1|nr:hypothetical protein [aff. Roholtiella sp. LEGE 12411]